MTSAQQQLEQSSSSQDDSNFSPPSRTQTVNASPSPLLTFVKPSANFWDNSETMKAARVIYLRMAVVGTLSAIVIIFGCLPLYWGALYKAPKPLSGLIVDFDGSTVGSDISQALESLPVTTIQWKVVPSSNFPGGTIDLATAIREEEAWIAVSINPNATQRLEAAIESVDLSYDGTSAITAYGAEARQESAYRNILRSNIQTALPLVCQQFAINFTAQLSASSNLDRIVDTAPHLLVSPISFTLNNLIPFNIPVATAVTFVGLIYLLILTFFLLNTVLPGRVLSGLEKDLSTASLIRLRLGTAVIAYFFISLFYTLLSTAFQLPTTKKFGAAGFLVLWMINYCGMLALGLALESMVTIMTPRFIGYFLISWIVVNVSVAVLPIEAQVNFFRFGYAMPFYNVSKGVRTIVFGTKNQLGLNFGILLAWSVLSSCTLCLFQVYTRQKEHRELAAVTVSASAKLGDSEKEPTV